MIAHGHRNAELTTLHKHMSLFRKMLTYASVLRLFENFDRQFYNFLVEQDRQFQNTQDWGIDGFRFFFGQILTSK